MPFVFLLAALAEVPDPRRAQGQRYSMRHLLLFSVLATLAGVTTAKSVGLAAFGRRSRLGFWFEVMGGPRSEPRRGGRRLQAAGASDKDFLPALDRPAAQSGLWF